MVKNSGEGRRRCRASKRVFYLSGMQSQVDYVSFVPDRDTTYGAIMHRDIYHLKDGEWKRPYVPPRAVVVAMLRKFKSEVAKRCFSCRPVPVEEFPYRYYTGRRLEKYVRAAVNFVHTGITRNIAMVAAFLKMEKNQILSSKQLTATNLVLKENECWEVPAGTLKLVVPRLVKPRPAEFNVGVGVYLRPLEKVTYDIIADIFYDDETQPVVMKGYDSFAQASYIRQQWLRVSENGRPIAIGLDASKFDQHVNEELLRWEHSIYKLFYPGDTHLAKLLSLQLRNRIKFRCDCGDETEGCQIKYVTAGGRCSGDMNTALGNCLLMCALVWSLCDSIGIPKTHRALINNGDDCVVIVTSEFVSHLQDAVRPWFEAVGIEMKIEPPVTEFERLEFCQTHPVFDGDRWRMVRNVRESLSKDSTIIKDISNKDVYPRYLKALGDCGLALTGGMPVLQSYYQCMLRSAKGVALTDPSLETGMAMLARGLHPYTAPITDSARISFDRAFDIPPPLQFGLEKYFDNLDLTYVEPSAHEPMRVPL